MTLPFRHAAIAAAVLALSCLGADPALAASSASASTGVVSVTLYDLNADDAIAPALTFVGGSSTSYASADANSVYDDQPLLGQPSFALATSALASGSGSTGAGGASAQAAAVGDGGGFQGYGSGQGVFSAAFELTPWTGIVIVMPFQGVSQTTVGYDGSLWEAANAQGSIGLTVNSDGGYENHTAYRDAYASYVWDGSRYVGQTSSFNGTVRLSFANLSDDTVTGSYYASAYAYAVSTVAVPELGTYSLMLAGLGALALTRRRARRR